MLADGVDQPRQGWRGAALVLAAEPVGLRGQVEECSGLLQGANGGGQHRAWQPGFGAFAVEHGKVGERRRLQGVEHRPAAIQVQGEGRLVDGLGANPQVQQATQGAEDQAAQGGTGHTVCALDEIFE
ncbi:hypothetical protein D3C85_1242040 [compost metagenome]